MFVCLIYVSNIQFIKTIFTEVFCFMVTQNVNYLHCILFLRNLIRCDAVSFYRHLLAVREGHTREGRLARWLTVETADKLLTVYCHAVSRLCFYKIFLPSPVLFWFPRRQPNHACFE